MFLSDDQMFEQNWATANFSSTVDQTLPFLPKVPYHYSLPCPAFESTFTGHDLAVEQCRRLYGIYQKPLNVLFSGGVDSQAMLHAVANSGVPFKVTIIEFLNELNQHDVAFGKYFCDTYYMPYDTLEIDIVRFYVSGEYLNFIEPFWCSSPQIALHLKGIDLIRQSQDCVILMGGSPIMELSGGNMRGIQEFAIVAWNRYAKTMGIPIVGNFHTWSQQLFYKYLKRGRMLSHIQDDYSRKCLIYQGEGLPVIKQRSKYTGFEEVGKYFQSAYPHTPDAFNAFFRHPHQDRMRVVTTAKILGSS